MAVSAGSKPSGYVHPLALRAIEELGLPLDGLRSKSVEEFHDQRIELSVTVCDHAKEACPVLPEYRERCIGHSKIPRTQPGRKKSKWNCFARFATKLNRKSQTIYLRIESAL